MDDQQPDISDPPIIVGSPVHEYHDSEYFDRGHIYEIAGQEVFVDFVDWKAKWLLSDLVYNYRDGRLVLVPKCPGQPVARFSGFVKSNQ